MRESFAYSGKVTIKTLHNNKVVKTRTIKNKGCKPLFDCIVRALKGNNISELAPRYIRLYNSSDFTEPLTQSNLENEVTVEKTVVPVSVDNSDVFSGTDEASIEYTFVVPASILSGVDATTPVNVLGIYNKEYSTEGVRANPSAYIVITDPDEQIKGTSMATGVSYVIIWKMTFQNQNESPVAAAAPASAPEE